ncbi:hypothetical protein PSTG_12508 [Puccinia striiformis f. sp. tritici PST-78]|uniref:Uncharacterized protein n=1 Tax=Puccinia striiformis f. sp. tritici PST-78 TaxID=1165861 RepID=A0A0L0V4H2_9BASI|nr:hypothetical protein PSTG_12508 [Puccinia striiformis f. sp. tritici PST-78]
MSAGSITDEHREQADSIIERFESISAESNSAMGDPGRSELDNIQLAWTKERSEIDSILKKYLGFVDRRSDSNDQLQLEPSDHEQMLKLAKLVIPIIKLYRLFMDKLSERGMNRKQLIPKFTTLCTAELDALVDLPYGANSKLCEILNILRGSDFNGEESSYDSLSQTVEAFQDDFRETASGLKVISQAGNGWTSKCDLSGAGQHQVGLDSPVEPNQQETSKKSMAGSTRKGKKAPNPRQLITKQVRVQANLIVERFESISAKCESARRASQSSPSPAD